jgi:hypothetical protein
MRNDDYRNDPKRLLPISDAKALGLGIETQRELEKLFRDNPGLAPPVLKIGGRNYIIAEDRDRFRNALIERALRETMNVHACAPAPLGAEA